MSGVLKTVNFWISYIYMQHILKILNIDIKCNFFLHNYSCRRSWAWFLGRFWVCSLGWSPLLSGGWQTSLTLCTRPSSAAARRRRGSVTPMASSLHRTVRGRGGGGSGIEKHEILRTFILFITDHDKCKHYDLRY